jgi:hypothetical protein
MACAFVPRTCQGLVPVEPIHASHSHPSQLLACLPESPGNSPVRALHPSIFSTCSFDIPRSILRSSTSKYPYPIPRRKYTTLAAVVLQEANSGFRAVFPSGRLRQIERPGIKTWGGSDPSQRHTMELLPDGQDPQFDSIWKN